MEIQRVRELLGSGARLVTLTGPGGVGKTRLALETIAQEAKVFADGVFFVPLQALTEPDQVLEELASVLCVRESGARRLLEDLCDALADKHTLICMDNWEHVLDAAPQLADLLAACRRLHVIAPAERRCACQVNASMRCTHSASRLKTNSVPSPLSKRRAFSYSARASAVKPSFAVNESNALIIGEICTLVDGLPLAIELVAALVRLFSPQALLARLHGNSGYGRRSPAIASVQAHLNQITPTNR